MKVFFEAFGGLIGVAVIGIVAIAAILAGDWLINRLARRHAKERPPEQGR